MSTISRNQKLYKILDRMWLRGLIQKESIQHIKRRMSHVDHYGGGKKRSGIHHSGIGVGEGSWRRIKNLTRGGRSLTAESER